MARIGLFFMYPFWDASMSTNEMKTLAEHTEDSISRSLAGINQEGAIQYEQQLIEYDEEHSSLYEFYHYKGVSGDSESEVRLKYQLLISQLYRRSAFLTIFGKFEYHLNICLDKMLELSSSTETRVDRNKGIPARVHNILTSVITLGIQSPVIEDIDYLRVIRNHIAHHNGFITPSNESKRLAIEKAQEAHILELDSHNEIYLSETFLTHTVAEFERYILEMNTAVENYYKHNFAPVSLDTPATVNP